MRNSISAVDSDKHNKHNISQKLSTDLQFLLIFNILLWGNTVEVKH